MLVGEKTSYGVNKFFKEREMEIMNSDFDFMRYRFFFSQRCMSNSLVSPREDALGNLVSINFFSLSIRLFGLILKGMEGLHFMLTLEINTTCLKQFIRKALLQIQRRIA